MPRGQRPGWKIRQTLPKALPQKRVKVATGIWMTRHGTFDAFVYLNGKSVYVGAFPALEVAVQKREEYLTERRGGAPIMKRSASKLRFGEFADDIYFVEVVAGRKASTIRAARARYNQHLKPSFADAPLREITYERCSKWRAEMLKKPLSGQTKRETILLLRAILGESVKRSIVPANPALQLDLPPKEATPISVPTYEVAMKVVNAIAAPVPRMLAQVLLHTGMRLNEAIPLTWSDVNVRERAITVRHSLDQITGEAVAPKTDRGKRTIKIPATLVTALKSYRRQQRCGSIPSHDPWVFPANAREMDEKAERPPVLNDRNFQQRHWNPALKAVKGADFTPHALRHLYASRLLMLGAPVAFAADQLGHSSPAFTYRQYVRFLSDQPDAANKYLDRAFGEHP